MTSLYCKDSMLGVQPNHSIFPFLFKGAPADSRPYDEPDLKTYLYVKGGLGLILCLWSDHLV